MFADNKALSRKVFEKLWNENREELIPELVAPEFMINDPYNPVTTRGPEAQRTYLKTYKTIFPDLVFKLDKQIAEDDFVVNYVTATATHEGEILGVPPTHKKATINCIVLMKFLNGKIVEANTLWDAFAFFKTTGVLDSLTELAVSHR